MKIYAVTQGEYSDYHICALTLSAEKAERIKKVYSTFFHPAEIEIYEDGEDAELNFLFCYESEFDDIYVENEGDHEEGVIPLDDNFNVYVRAEDQEHARKKAYDMIAKYKAQKYGL